VIDLDSVAMRRGWWLGLAVMSALVIAGCTSASMPVPTLGRQAGVFTRGEGFGHVKPTGVYNGGDRTGLVQHVVWKSWGGPRAVGTGIGEYVGPGQFPATGTEERTTIVAFDLGLFHGKRMYQAVEWYYPQHGQKFNPRQYEDICSGTYVPGGL
jgi:hypothetical protein